MECSCGSEILGRVEDVIAYLAPEKTLDLGTSLQGAQHWAEDRAGDPDVFY